MLGLKARNPHTTTRFRSMKISCVLFDSDILGCRNIVATVNLGCVLNLKTIAMHARNAEYNPKRFAAVIMRIR
jgi:hypothetical protein